MREVGLRLQPWMLDPPPLTKKRSATPSHPARVIAARSSSQIALARRTIPWV